MVYNVLLAGGLGHSDGNLVNLPYLRLLLATQPRWGGVSMFTPSGFCVRPNLGFVVSFPRVSVFAQYVRGASGGGIDYRFAVFLIPLVLTIFDFLASVVGGKVVSTFNTAFGPLNF